MSVGTDWQKYYRELRQRDPELYRKAIQYGEGVSLTHTLSDTAAADVERALVMLALEILQEVRP